MSVKKIPADEIKRLRANVESYYNTVKAKSGVAAKEAADEAVRKYKKESPYIKPEVHVVKSGDAKPYKITGGAGSTADVGKPQGTQAGHAVTDSANHTKPVVSSGPSMETRMGAVGGRGGGLLEQMR